jgi:hypothetical protein
MPLNAVHLEMLAGRARTMYEELATTSQFVGSYDADLAQALDHVQDLLKTLNKLVVRERQVTAFCEMCWSHWLFETNWNGARPVQDGNGRGYFITLEGDRMTVGGVMVAAYSVPPTTSINQRQALVAYFRKQGIACWTHGHQF